MAVEGFTVPAEQGLNTVMTIRLPNRGQSEGSEAEGLLRTMSRTALSQAMLVPSQTNHDVVTYWFIWLFCVTNPQQAAQMSTSSPLLDIPLHELLLGNTGPLYGKPAPLGLVACMLNHVVN